MYGATLHAKKPNIKLKQVNTIDSTEKGLHCTRQTLKGKVDNYMHPNHEIAVREDTLRPKKT